MSKPKLTPWLSGNPVRSGEYIASKYRNDKERRWWNGEYWSVNYSDSSAQYTKNILASCRSAFKNAEIEYKGLAENPND